VLVLGCGPCRQPSGNTLAPVPERTGHRASKRVRNDRQSPDGRNSASRPSVSNPELINLSELFAGHRAVAEGVCRAGFGEKEGAAVVVEPVKAGL
jgi:hypothetical protein